MTLALDHLAGPAEPEAAPPFGEGEPQGEEREEGEDDEGSSSHCTISFCWFWVRGWRIGRHPSLR